MRPFFLQIPGPANCFLRRVRPPGRRQSQDSFGTDREHQELDKATYAGCQSRIGYVSIWKYRWEVCRAKSKPVMLTELGSSESE